MIGKHKACFASRAHKMATTKDFEEDHVISHHHSPSTTPASMKLTRFYNRLFMNCFEKPQKQLITSRVRELLREDRR